VTCLVQEVDLAAGVALVVADLAEVVSAAVGSVVSTVRIPSMHQTLVEERGALVLVIVRS
jgi:hypothetical protein